ncbi:MAG: exodeoxyribonuclease III [Pyrinomonadaceae bacterium]
MKIATWNVNSINARMPHLTKWCAEAQPDVVCLQETKCVDDSFPYQAILDLGYHTAFYGQKSYNGVAILSKYEIGDVVKGFPEDDEDSQKRLIAATVNGVRVVNTYIPNGSELWTDKFAAKLDWLQTLRRFFDDNYQPDENVLLCGDFNVAPDELDVWSVPMWEGKIHFSKPERAAIHFIKQWGFTDIYRKLNGEKQEFSWWNYREGAWQRNRGLRIDHIWTSQPLADKCTGCWIDKDPRKEERPSDHTPVVAEFKM